MNLTSIKTKTVVVAILDPSTQKPTGFAVTLQHKSAPEPRAVMRSIQDDVYKAGQRGRKLTADMIESNKQRFLASLIVGWEFTDGATWADDVVLLFSEANKSQVLAVDWIVPQIDEAVNEDASFFVS